MEKGILVREKGFELEQHAGDTVSPSEGILAKQ